MNEVNLLYPTSSNFMTIGFIALNLKIITTNRFVLHLKSIIINHLTLR